MEYRLCAEALSVGYGGEPVLRELTFSLRSGEILAVIGPNGAGKSTLLKTLIRQLEPMGGVTRLNGRDMAAMGEAELARALSIVLTDRLDGELLTVEDVVRSGRYPYTGRLGILSPHDWAAVEEALRLTASEDLRYRYFRHLSDGQRQRVLLARAVCQEPDVLALDEPTAFLDLKYQLELLTLLRDLSRRRSLAVILSLHELAFARKVADEVLCVRNGAADRFGPPEILTPAYIEHLYGLPAGSYASLFPSPGESGEQTGLTANNGEPSDQTGSGEPHYSFYQNRKCEMFPCHKGVEPNDFNCLFCYCPLYTLGSRCGGNFTRTDRGVKNCTDCTFPHVREHYHAVLSRFPELSELAAGSE